MISHRNTDQIENTSLERFVDSQPILNMLKILSESGHSNFNEYGEWEVCLCSLILTIEPNCRVQRILESLPYKHKALDEADVLNTMAHLGYLCRMADCSLEAIDERLLPGLFTPYEGKPCIILGRNTNGILQFFDPLSRLISTVPSSFEKEGKVWFFQRFDENVPATSKFMRKSTGYSWFRALHGRFKGTLAQIMTAGLILNLIALVTPLFIMLVYDRVIAAGSVDALPMLVLGAFIAIVFEWKLRNIRSQGLSWLSGRLDNIVSNKIFSHLIGLSPDLIERASVAAQIARIKTFESVRDFFSGSVFLSLLEAPFVIISIIAIALIAGPLALVPVSMILAYVALFIFIRRYVKVAIRIAAKTSSARQQFTIETFEKIHGIRAHGLEKKWQEKFRHLFGREMMSHFHLGWLGIVAETVAHSITVISAVATVGFGVFMIWEGVISTGALVATMILVWRVLTPFYSLCTMIPRLEQLRNSIIQVNDLMDIETEAELAKSFSRLPKIRGAINFCNTGFRYGQDGDKIFSDLSFEAQAGDFVAITGSNGSGKGTVLKLIKSLHKPHEGSILIDGFDIRQLDAPNLRRQIAYMPKTAEFFHGTIAENLRFSNPIASDKEIRSALELSDAWNEVSELQDGLETIIGFGSAVNLRSNLSTKLALARLYLHTGQILLIDELPNTILASKAGKNLKEYLARIKGKRTVIMVTYRDDFLKMADTIVWMKNQEAPLVGPRDKMYENLGAMLGA